MVNIKFLYMYRCGGNYKKYNEVVFANPDNIDVLELESLIRAKLLENLWFLADEWLFPDLHFDDWDNDLDNPYHEFESVTYTDESADFSVSLWEWISLISKLKPPFI